MEAKRPVTILNTKDAAAQLLRSPQTLRKWACLNEGPIKPIHIAGRLGWRTSDIERLLADGTAKKHSHEEKSNG